MYNLLLNLVGVLITIRTAGGSEYIGHLEHLDKMDHQSWNKVSRNGDYCVVIQRSALGSEHIVTTVIASSIEAIIVCK